MVSKTSDDELMQLNGKVIMTMELALKHGFKDVSGELPDGPFSSRENAEGVRAAFNSGVFQYNEDATIPDPNETNNLEIAKLFPGA